MNTFIMAHKRRKSESSGGSGSSGSAGSDLFELGILPKPISQFNNGDIGTTVFIPYTDTTGKILLNEGRIEFEVVGVNHHKDTNNADTPTITLMTKNLIRRIAFDAKETSNSDSDRKSGGNNRWSVSNIRQWLNSSGDANSWFKQQHTADAEPIASNLSSPSGAYIDAPGFLKGFDSDVLQHFTDITNITAKPTIDGGGSETTVDKVFLPSYTEMGFGENNGVAEGTWLSVKYKDANSRIKSTKDGVFCKTYWMRSPVTTNSTFVNSIFDPGYPRNDQAIIGLNALAPIIVLH